MYTQTQDLNIIPEGVRPVIYVSQYDNQTTALKFSLYKRDTAFSIPSGAAVLINGIKPDMHGFSYAASATSGNTVTFAVTQQMTAVAGDVLCELRVRTSSQIIGTLNFILRVEPAPLTDETIISDTEIPLIEQAVDIAANLAEYIQATYTNAAASQVSANAAATSATEAANSASSAATNAASVQNLYNSIETAKANANAAAEAAQDAADVIENLTATATTLAAGSSATASYSNGVLTLGIPTGATGASGVTTPLTGFFTMWVDDNGDLYVASETDMSDYFSYNSETGNLYFLTEDGE